MHKEEVGYPILKKVKVLHSLEESTLIDREFNILNRLIKYY